MLVKVNEELMSYDQTPMIVDIVIRDEHNDLKEKIYPSIYPSIYPLLTEHIYTFELDVEEVTSTELVFEFPQLNKRNWKIGECGILQRETRSLRRSSSPDLSPESSRAFSLSLSLSPSISLSHELVNDSISPNGFQVCF
jgi:hypothetical protein